MTTLNQKLKKIGYNDSPLRRELINTFKEWLQQKLTEVKLEHKNIPSIVTYGTILYLKKLLKDLNKK